MRAVLDKRFVADRRFEALPLKVDHGEVVGTGPKAEGRFYDVGEHRKEAPSGSLRDDKRTRPRIVQPRQLAAAGRIGNTLNRLCWEAHRCDRSAT